MKNLTLSSALLLAAIAFSQICCQKDPTKPENSRVYTVTLQIASTPVRGASVSIETESNQYVATSDENGKAELAIPNEVPLPPLVIVTADHSSIKPEARALPGSQDSDVSRSITCEASPSRVLVREAALHHIGDDDYGGEPNSQLQISTEGTRLSFTFNLASIPSSMPYIRVFARGIQYPLQIKINGITTDRFGNSPSDGDLGRYTYQLTANPATVFRAGSNVLTLESYYRTNEDDWDDLEFCSLLLYYP